MMKRHPFCVYWDRTNTGRSLVTSLIRLDSLFVSVEPLQSMVINREAPTSRVQLLRNWANNNGMLKLSIVVFVAALVASTSAFNLFNPLRASCDLDWTFDLSCSEVNNRLVQQIQDWSHDDCPGTSDTCPTMPCGQQCKYKLLSSNNTLILAEHRTPVKDYLDNMKIDFEANGDNKCNVHGFSESDLWYAVLDMGTNYCNLRRLAIGTDLINAPGFTEDTSIWKCTQYTMADCDRF